MPRSTVHGWSRHLTSCVAQSHSFITPLVFLVFLGAYIIYFIFFPHYDPAWPFWASILSYIPLYLLIGAVVGMAYYITVWFLDRKSYERADDNVTSPEAGADGDGDEKRQGQFADNISIVAFPKRVARRMGALPRAIWRHSAAPVSDTTLLFDVEDHLRAEHRESALRQLEGFDDVALGRIATPEQMV